MVGCGLRNGKGLLATGFNLLIGDSLSRQESIAGRVGGIEGDFTKTRPSNLTAQREGSIVHSVDLASLVMQFSVRARCLTEWLMENTASEVIDALLIFWCGWVRGLGGGGR